jgi:putative ATP-dependent endonuclease of the OLD family
MSKYQITEDDGQTTTKDLTLETKKDLARKLEGVIRDKEWLGLIKSEKLVNEHLEKADISKKESRIHLRLLEHGPTSNIQSDDTLIGK